MIAGDPDALDAAAVALAGTTGLTDTAAGIEAAAVTALAGWEGRAATAAGVGLARFGPALTAGDDACRALVPALRRYAEELHAAQEVAAASGPGANLGSDRLRAADEAAAAAVEQAREQLAAMRVEPPDPAAGAPPPSDADEPGLLNTLGHTALDLVGLVPIVGEAADVANAAWYGLEGDHVAAGLSLAAAIPIAGWAFTGGKLGIKGVDTVKAVTDTGGAAAWVKGRPSVVPWNAERRPYNGGPGEKYRWKDPASGKTVDYHAHPPSATAPKGSHAAEGPTYRLQVGNHYLDAAGNPYTRGELNERSPAFNPHAADATHIPYPSNQPVGWDAGRRVFVPNPASLGDGTTGTEESPR